MLRRHFLTFPAVWQACAAPRYSALLLSSENIDRIRAEIGRAPGVAAPLRKQIDQALIAGPWSVTFHRPRNPKPAPNDYYSEAPYWWPDPKNPSGPFIRKDGERYPERDWTHRRYIGELADATLVLGMGAAFLGDSRCAARAEKVLSVWFLDSKTRMNPHLEFGQAVRGRNEGRGSGIIETVSLIYVVQGILLLEAAGKLDSALRAGLRRWYADYLRWLTESPKGRDEMNAGNNHATWWTAQVAAYATFTENEAAKRLAWERYRTHLVPTQIQPDGSCPREEARTRSLSYSAMNLDGFSILCRIAEGNGVDLWRFKTAKGTGVEKSFYYLMPYVLRPETWKKKQITVFDQDRTVFLALAGLGLQSPELLAAYRKLPRAGTPLVLLVDYLVRTA